MDREGLVNKFSCDQALRFYWSAYSLAMLRENLIFAHVCKKTQTNKYSTSTV